MINLRLAVTDQVVGDQPVFIKCREHNDKRYPNLAVYVDHLHCFVCGFHMNLIDKEGNAWDAAPGHRDPLAYILKVPEEEAAKVASKYTNEAIDRYREKAAQESRMDPLARSLATIYNKILNSPERKHRLQWFYDRGLTDRTINDPDVLLGHNGTQFIIPIFDKERKLVSLRYRMDPEYCTEQEIGKHKYMGMKGRNGLYIYPEPLLDNAGSWREELTVDKVYICEGELDALRLWQEGRPAVSVTNGAGQVEKLPALLKAQYPLITHLCIATDQDEPGEEAAERTKKAAEALGFTTFRWHWKEAKDVTEHLQNRRAA